MKLTYKNTLTSCFIGYIVQAISVNFLPLLFVFFQDTYKVSFLALPAGYTYVDDVQEFYFENGSMEMTITLKAAE